MVNRCCVDFCSTSSTTKKVSLHNFTKDINLQKIWIQNIREVHKDSLLDLPPFKITAHTKICSQHFMKSDFRICSEKSRLKPTAVPVIFPWTKPTLDTPGTSPPCHRVILLRKSKTKIVNGQTNNHIKKEINNIDSSPVAVSASSSSSESSTDTINTQENSSDTGHSMIKLEVICEESSVTTNNKEMQNTQDMSCQTDAPAKPELDLDFRKMYFDLLLEFDDYKSRIEDLKANCNCYKTVNVKPNIIAPQEFCRLCSKQHRVYHSLFATEGAQMLESMTSMKVSIDDPASNFACSKCFSDLSNAYDIQQRFLAVERSHRKELTTIEHVPIKEEFIESCDNQYALPECCEHLKKSQNTASLMKCRFCPKEMPVDEYRTHRTTHLDGFCEYCGATLKHIDCLRVHVSNNHREPKRHCDKCNLEFGNLKEYNLHVTRVHIGKASYICEKCGSQFFRKGALSSHIRTKHLGMDQWPCEVCGKKYSKKHLERHKKLHSGEKPFVCEFCGRGFSLKCNMNLHKTNIHGWKDAVNFKCFTCEKGFSSYLALTVHLKIHSKNKV